MIKTITCILTLFCGSILLHAQPYFDWANHLGGADYDLGTSVAVDAQGNVYTTGAFLGTADFNPGSGTFNLTSAGDFDIFISKVDATGNFVWARQLGGTDFEIASFITVDAQGNVYTTGYFAGTADFNPGSGTFNISSTGNADIFISKLDASGNFSWARQMGGTLNDIGYSITVDTKGNVYTTGGFEGTADFNPGAGTFNLSSTGATYNLFISKLNSAGNFVWAKKFGGTGDNEGNSIAVDAAGNVYTTGYFDNTTDFDPGTGTYNLSSFGNTDIFISKLDSSGNFILARQFGGTSIDRAYSIALDASGNVYTTGSFYDVSDFNPGSGTHNLTSNGNEDVFVSKLDASCNFVWAKNFGGTIDDIAYSIAVDKNGAVYTTGYFNSAADFDPGSNTYNFTTSEGNDIFISKLDASGNFAWAKQIGGTGFDNRGYSIKVDAARNIYTTGYFNDTADFNPNPASYLLVSEGSLDIFTQKMSQCIKTSSTISQTACNSYTSPSGRYTWTISNTYKDTIPNAGGCDSVMTINLIINKNTSGTITVTACNKFTSPSGKYQWTNSNTYKDTIANKKGCDSAMTINLTINQNSSSTITVTGCNKYTSPSGKYKWTSSNIYKDTIANKKGCDSAITINLTINTLDVSVTQNGTTLTANLAGATYQWINCNNGNQPISGKTSQIFTTTINGSYAVVITQGSCTDTSLCFNVTTASVEDNNTKTALTVYPNPGNGILTVTSGSVLSYASLKLIDIQGRTILERTALNGTDFTLDISAQADGIYFIELQQENKIVRVKLLKY